MNWREYFAWPAFFNVHIFSLIGNLISNLILVVKIRAAMKPMMRKSAFLLQLMFREERRRSWLQSRLVLEMCEIRKLKDSHKLDEFKKDGIKPGGPCS